MPEFRGIFAARFKVSGTTLRYHLLMEANTALMAPMPARDTTVSVLQCRTSSDMDFAVLRALDHQHGTDAAAEVICTQLERIALLVGQLPELTTAGHLDRVGTVAVAVSDTAMLLGLRDLACAAGHVGVCADRADGIALSATIGRLERAFDAAVARVWDYWES